ncbi:PH domain-containing protein [Eudoraea sp.]|uniref:PH domain-containing protein n=1 Tax=Eudoraea sp. TaxID=1979955 RepID=UPI003C713F7A
MNVILILGFAFIIYLFLNIEYIIVERKLKIKCGFFYTKALNIDMIKSITRTNSIISAPAASLDRIELLYNDNGKFDSIIISPKDKVNFTKELMKINPNIINKIIE